MKMALKKILCLAIAYGCSLVLNAQTTASKYDFGINAGTFIYQGDLTPSAIGSFKTPAFVLGLNASRHLNNSFALRLDVNFGRLKGDDGAYKNPAWRQQRDLAFKTPATELIGSVVWNPSGSTHKFSPYVLAGIGYAFLKIKRDYSHFNTEYFSTEPTSIEGLNNDIAHTLPKGIPIIPLGVGLQYRLGKNLSLNTEASYRIGSTDYLDGFSQVANPGKKDNYYKFSIGLIYSRNKNYGGRLDCPARF